MNNILKDPQHGNKEARRHLKEALSSLEKRNQYLLSAIKLIKEAYEMLDPTEISHEDDETMLQSSSHSPKLLVEKKSKHNDIEKLKSANGYDLFLWGLKKLGGEATIAEVFSEVENLDLDFVRRRVKDQTLKQWLNVSASALAKNGTIEKMERTERKGGVIYKL
ncbi:MAG: hypothetical protein J7604_18725 [Sporocytophaga sp.]|uniref:hypothetical protein n=1 Tax=Sporocytophaga sp. TaxID=2231183 RepID=UPI001B2619CC|nr:hypothetical protein [Sporocytophaga sp.]MBO9702251.1 hypothetical protein [Sporocytophaga sp.]